MKRRLMHASGRFDAHFLGMAAPTDGALGQRILEGAVCNATKISGYTRDHTFHTRVEGEENLSHAEGRESRVRSACATSYYHVDRQLGMIGTTMLWTIWQIAGRPTAYAPATFSKDPETRKIADFTGHLAVMVLGDFDFEPLPSAARLGLIKVMSEAQRKFRVPTSHIQPHKDHVEHNGEFGTSCPGEHIYGIKDELAQMTLVYGIESELNARGCDAGGADGIVGQRTREALARLKQTQPVGFTGDDISDVTLFSSSLSRN